MAKTPADGPLEHQGKRYENLDDYVRGFLAAVRTHRRLTDERTLEVKIDPGADLPLAQRIMLR